MNRLWRLSICILSLGVCSAAQTASHPTPDDTRREFEAICECLTGDNIYYGDAIVGDPVQQLADLPADSYRRAEQHGHLGWELSQLGRHLEAIESVTLQGPGSGIEQVFHDIRLDRFYQATEGKADLELLELRRIRWTSQPDTSTGAHHHQDGG